MFVSKMGKEHLEYGRNCQDYGMAEEKIRMVCDGCSEGAHTEVGAKAFVHLIKQGYHVDKAFEKLMELFGQTPAAVRDFLCFTIIQVEERKEEYQVSYCGDGYVILNDVEGKITFLELGGGESPMYYAYRYVNRKFLKRYRDGVRMERCTFSKEQYQRVGAATDGLRFVVRKKELREAFIRALQTDREVQVKRFVNKYQAFLKDDFTIAW